MIGNAQEAEFIHDWHHAGNAWNETLPWGWQRLGEGCYRTGYLSPSGVVYKVQQEFYSNQWQTNLKEWETWKRLYLTCRMPRHSRLPKLYYHPLPDIEGQAAGVIAIENLAARPWGDQHPEGEVSITWSDVMRQISVATQVGDLYGSNVRMSEDGLLVPSDLGDGDNNSYS